MVRLVQFGSPLSDSLPRSHTQAAFRATFDQAALWDPESIEKLLDQFPEGLVRESDLYLALVECISNAATHGKAEALCIDVRTRHNIMLVSIFHLPGIQPIVDTILAQARTGWLPDLTQEEPDGLGYPILFRLTRRVTITPDRTRLQLWFKTGIAA